MQKITASCWHVPWSSCWWRARCDGAVYRCGHHHHRPATVHQHQSSASHRAGHILPAPSLDTLHLHYCGSDTRFHARCEVYLESSRKIFAFAEKYLWLLAQLTVVMVTGRAVKMMTPSWRVSLWWWGYSHHAGPVWPGRVRRPKHNIIVTTVKKPY